MSGKRKGSLLGRVLGGGKNKDNDEEGSKKNKKKGTKLERMPSVRERESFQSDRRSIPSVTHASEAPMHYEEHHGGHMHHYEEHRGAPVTAVHDEDPYSPIGDGDSAGRPSMINIHQPGGGGGYFGHGFQASPRNTIIRASVAYDHLPEHVEGDHEGGGFRMAHEAGDMHATPSSSRSQVPRSGQSQTIMGPRGSTEPTRMLKPGDQMEIDPTNPPTFVIDEGVTLEIGDEVNGFIPYEQYLAELAARPPPKTGGTYIVQGGGDVVIQDETGKVIKTIPGTGAMAGRGEPKIYESPAATTIATFTTTFPATSAHRVRVVIRHTLKEQSDQVKQVEQLNQVNQIDQVTQTPLPKTSVKTLPSKFSKFSRPSKPSKSPKSAPKALETSSSSPPSPPLVPSLPSAPSAPSTSPEPPKPSDSAETSAPSTPSAPLDVVDVIGGSIPAEPVKRPQAIKRLQPSITTKSTKSTRTARSIKPQPRPLTVFFTRPFQKRLVHDPLNPLEAIKEPLPSDAFPYASLFGTVEELVPRQVIQPTQPISMIPMASIISDSVVPMKMDSPKPPTMHRQYSEDREHVQGHEHEEISAVPMEQAPTYRPMPAKEAAAPTPPLNLQIVDRPPWFGTSEASIQTSPQASIRLSIPPTRAVSLPPLVSPIPRSPVSPVDVLNLAMDGVGLDVAAGQVQLQEDSQEEDNIDSDLSLHNIVDVGDVDIEENNWPPRSSMTLDSPRRANSGSQWSELQASPKVLTSEPLPIPSRRNSGAVPRRDSNASFSMDAAITGSFDNPSMDNVLTIEGQEQDQYLEQEQDITSTSAYVFDQMPIADPASRRGSIKARASNPYTRLRDPSVLPVLYSQHKPRSDSVSSLPLPPPMVALRQTKRVPTPMPTPPPQQPAKVFIQPTLNASPKIRELIGRLESGQPEDYDNLAASANAKASPSSTPSAGIVTGAVSQIIRSMTGTPSLSRNGSISSLSRMDIGSSPRLPPSRSGSRPSTPGFGSPGFLQGFVTEEPQAMEPMEFEPGTSVPNAPNASNTSNPPHRRTGSATGMGSRDPSPHRKFSSRTYMVEAIPGLDVQQELMRELSQRRLRRTNNYS